MSFASGVKVFQGVAFIGGIGAGILGLPFAVASVGLSIGIPYIILVGLLMMGVNLLIGDIVIRTKKKSQLAGLAGLYLGHWGQTIMVLLTYTLLFAALLIYIIGEGEALRSLFGGSSVNWSILFVLLSSACVFWGMKIVKRVDVFLLLLLTVFLSLIIGSGISHFNPETFQIVHWENIFFPYGILVFAFHASTSIPEAYEVVGSQRLFRRSIVYATIFNIVMYSLFAMAVVGVMGSETTAIATIGLGEKIGTQVLIFGNLFAVVAMGMAFLNVASSVRDSLRWDFSFDHSSAAAVACFLPFILFAVGLRQFIQLVDVIGGVIMSLELLLLLLIYWRASHLKRPSKQYVIHHTAWVFIILILVFSLGTVYSVIKLF